MAVDYKASSDVSREALVQAGLSKHQASVYEALIHYGPQKATKVAFLSGVPRTLSYKVLDELEAQGLVSKKDEPGKVSVFTPAHPLKLKELADQRLEEAKGAKVALEGTLAKLISDFNTVAGSPGVRILEGVAGVAELYEDELNEAQPIRLIRSPKDDDHPELEAMVQRQIAEQVKIGLKVRVIAPMTPGTPAKIISKDKERLVERRIVPWDEFPIPAQVVIYANKVALTSYGEVLMTTIIENTAIRQTFEIIFEYLWKLSEPEHQRILATLQ
ncbi:MAG TPA: helix-turn-helix domain-containing protein [Candidatus Paceibacterota bacterium]|jgi:sugar-specific transcriptional regulator TrmB|nr:helix-turn-helix domain-containing protein [Candidatus Paceibacterota bacterium]